MMLFWQGFMLFSRRRREQCCRGASLQRLGKRASVEHIPIMLDVCIYNPLSMKSFHGISGRNVLKCLPKTCIGKVRLKNLVTHVPHKYYQCTRVPREHGRRGRRTFWTYHTRLCLRHVGDVTVVLSKKGRNVSPHNTKLLVTNLAELTPSQVVCIYQKRWAIELMNWELKSGLGLGEHQVSGDNNRSEKSVGIAVLAYLLVMRMCHHEIVPGKPWSIFQLQHALRLRVMTNQVEHQVKVKMAKTRKAA